MASVSQEPLETLDDSPLSKHDYLTDDDEYDPANVTFSDGEDNDFSGEIPDYDSPPYSEEEDSYVHPIANSASSPPPQARPARDPSPPAVVVLPKVAAKNERNAPKEEDNKEDEVRKEKSKKKKNKKKKKKGKRAGNAPAEGNPEVRRPCPDEEENPELQVPADVVDAANYQEYSDNTSEGSDQEGRRLLRARRRMPAGSGQYQRQKPRPVHNPYENIPESQHGGRLMDAYDYQAEGNYSTGNVTYVPEGSHGGGIMNVPPDMGYTQGLYEHYWQGTQDCFRPLIMQMMAAPLPPGTGVQAYRTVPNIFPKGPPTFNHQFDGSDVILVSTDNTEFHCHYSLLASQCWRFPQYPIDTGKISLPYNSLVILRALEIFYGVPENLWEPLSDENIVQLSNFYAYTASTLIFNYCYLTVQRWTFDRQIKYYLCTLEKFPIHKIFLLWMVAAKPNAAVKVIEQFYNECQDRDKVLSWEDIFWVSWMCYKISGVILKP